jgi:hypothetical protein
MASAGFLAFFAGHLTRGQCGATLASLHKQQVNTSLVYYRAPPGPNTTFVFVSVVVCCSTANASGLDPRASLWAPMPTFDEKEQLWHLFYVQYFSAPSNASGSVCPHGERPRPGRQLYPFTQAVNSRNVRICVMLLVVGECD